MNLAAKYRPQSFSDMTEQTAVVDILKKICSDSDLPNRNFLLIGPAGTGKAQPLYSKVLTPRGFIKMSEVQVGTKVIDGDGFVSEVTGVYPQGSRICYRITFDDNSHIDVADNHLNSVLEVDVHENKAEDKVVTTEDLIKARKYHNKLHFINIQGRDTKYCDPSSFIHPYLAGVFASQGRISDGDVIFDDLSIAAVSRLNRILDNDWVCHLEPEEKVGFRIAPSDASDNGMVQSFIQELQTYFPGLLAEDRRLPDECIGWSAKNRNFLLEGLKCQ